MAEPSQNLTVGDLIEKLHEYPKDAELGLRMVGPNDEKVILVAQGYELDPIFQWMRPTIRGYRW